MAYLLFSFIFYFFYQAFRNVLSGKDEEQGESGDAIVKGKVMIDSISFEVLQADITQETTDCIVNGTNDKLDLNTGLVSKAIVKAAGNSVVQECKKLGIYIYEYSLLVFVVMVNLC